MVSNMLSYNMAFTTTEGFALPLYVPKKLPSETLHSITERIDIISWFWDVMHTFPNAHESTVKEDQERIQEYWSTLTGDKKAAYERALHIPDGTDISSYDIDTQLFQRLLVGTN